MLVLQWSAVPGGNPQHGENHASIQYDYITHKYSFIKMSKCKDTLCLPHLAARQPRENNAIFVVHQQLTRPAISFPNSSLKVMKSPSL